MNDVQRAERVRHLLDRAMAGDVEAAREDITRFFQIHIPFLGPLPRGERGLAVAFSFFREGIPDAVVSLHDLVTEHDRLAARLTVDGAHDGPFQTMLPTGKPVAASGLALWRFSGERIAEMWAYINVWQIVYEQLGAYDIVNSVFVDEA